MVTDIGDPDGLFDGEKPILRGVENEDVRRVLYQGQVDADDLRALRGHVFADGVVSCDEADLLFTLHHSLTEESALWRAFFVEALTDYVVHQAQPRGYVSPENAVWLIEKIMADDHVETSSELEAVIRVLETARSAPDQLSAFALIQVRKAVLQGHGAAKVLEGDEAQSKPGVVTSADVKLLQRILYSCAGEDGIGISTDEAAVLFDINDETRNADNAPEWAELFVKAVANAVMFASGYQVPDREEALRLEAFLESREGVGGFLSRMAGAVMRFDFGSSESDGWADRLDLHQEAARTGEIITQDEAHWLIEQIGRDGVFDENERAIIGFIAEESPVIDPALVPLIERVQAAA